MSYIPCRGERYARAALMPAHEFSAIKQRSNHELAIHFQVPLEQVAQRREELAGGVRAVRWTRPRS